MVGSTLCTVYEVGEADGQAYIAMELIDGRPLRDSTRGCGARRPTSGH